MTKQNSIMGEIIDYLILMGIILIFLNQFIPISQWSKGVLTGDANLNVWVLTSQWQTVVSDPLNLWEGNAFYPDHKMISGSDHLFSQFLVGWPVQLLSNNFYFSYHFLIFLAFAVGAIGFYKLIFWITSNRSAAMISATYFSIAFPRLIHSASHLQIVSFQWMPWILYVFLRYLVASRFRFWVGFVSFSILQLLSGWYLAIQTLFAIGLAFIVWYRKIYSGAHLISLSLCVIVIFLFVVPFAVPYMGRPVQDLDIVPETSANWLDYLTPPTHLLESRLLDQGSYWGESSVFIGWFSLVLVLSLVAGGKCKNPDLLNFILYAVILVLIGWLLSLGPRWSYPDGFKLPFYYLSKFSSTFQQLRSPARFSQLFIFGFSILMAIAFSKIEQNFKQRKTRRILYLVVLVLVCLEHFPFVKITPVNSQIPKVYDYISRLKVDAVVAEIPTYYGTDLWGFDSDYLVFSLSHNHRIINGYSRFVSEGFKARMSSLKKFPSEKAVNQLSQWGVDYFILHKKRYFKAEIASVIMAGLVKNDPIVAINSIIEMTNSNFNGIESKMGDLLEAEADTKVYLQKLASIENDIVYKIKRECL